MNETKRNDYDDYHHDDDDVDNGRYLFMFNSSNTLVAELSGAPVFRNFTATVYIVDKSNEIFRSEEFLIQTPEGGKWEILACAINWKKLHKWIRSDERTQLSTVKPVK